MQILVASCWVSIIELEVYFLEHPFQEGSRLAWLQEKIAQDL